ncbi:MAG: SAM-dependent methyltransferase, partial [Desulfosarcinaceae bacterium]
PGYALVKAAAAGAVRIVPVPGPSAVMGALCASGLGTDQFAFVGFPSRKKARRLEQIREVADFAGTLVFYQSPRRLLAFLEELREVLGDRRAVLARELTKVHEEFIRGPLSHVHAKLSLRDQIKGECTLLIEGQSRRIEAPDQQWEPALRAALQEEPGSMGDIAKAVAKQFGLKKQDVYNKALRIRKEKE